MNKQKLKTELRQVVDGLSDTRKEIERLTVELSQREYKHLELTLIDDHNNQKSELRYDCDADAVELGTMLAIAMKLHPAFRTAVLFIAEKWESGEMQGILDDVTGQTGG